MVAYPSYFISPTQCVKISVTSHLKVGRFYPFGNIYPSNVAMDGLGRWSNGMGLSSS